MQRSCLGWQTASSRQWLLKLILLGFYYLFFILESYFDPEGAFEYFMSLPCSLMWLFFFAVFLICFYLLYFFNFNFIIFYFYYILFIIFIFKIYYLCCVQHVYCVSLSLCSDISKDYTHCVKHTKFTFIVLRSMIFLEV